MSRQQPVVAITGGIGSGKSIIAKLFESWGATVVDADLLAREVVAPGSTGLRRLSAQFSENLILPDGSLNRPLLASIIFSDAAKKKLVEQTLHPLIRERWLEKLAALRASNAPMIAYIVPLFFESSTRMDEIEKVILISAPEETRIQRIMARDGFSRDAAELRIKAQLPDSEKIPKSDFVIMNDSTLDELTTRARVVFDAIAGAPRAT